MKSNDGTLIPKYRVKRENVEFVACIFCLVMYASNHLKQHSQQCLQKPSSDQIKKRESRHFGRNMLSIPDDIAPAIYKSVIVPMIKDQISDFVKTDKFILAVGSRLFTRLAKTAKIAQQVSSKL